MAFTQLYNLTEELLLHLERQPDQEEREEYIDKIMGLLDKRDQVLTQIVYPSNREEKQKGEKIVEMDKVIKQKLTVLFTTIKQDISKLNQSKEPQKKYRNPYDTYNPDGRFFDKRK
ncbi:hypothetical protein RGU12_20995 [Fredinandcohnia sp. QZ13]|uniref:hypothetical protein n=1 Tax=Fredinandcohnia sp. QZ13 TaxID=3073144 RepID=UPI00285356FB|nr:hypothetical protein [Fredinandcohnia sp. QZ13]MDR4889977.1 hypothetical protein [Fredinandcohnia sp. QZ13]